METLSKTTNLASPLVPDFSPDDLSLIIGTCLPQAVAILDPVDGKILGGNCRLEEFLGLSLESGAEAILLESFVHPEDASLFRICRTADFATKDGSIEVRFRSQGGFLNAEVYLSSFRWQRQEYLLTYILPRVDHSSVEVELKERIVEQKRKTLEAIKSSLLIYQFTEKIKKTPVLTTSLLTTDNETQLFERAARILTCEGLNYKDVTFLLVVNDCLEVCYSTKPLVRKSYPVSDDQYSQFLQNANVGVQEQEGEVLLVPLRSRGTLLGLIEVCLHPRERIFFDEVNLVSTWQKDALLTIGDMIALLLDNLRLYREVKRQSIIDPLTGVYNRNYFTDCLSDEITSCVKKGFPISMIFLDVDHFKDINDTYGHVVGDQILQGLGLLLKKNLRGYDFICRYGGDEFIVLLPNVDGERAQRIANKLLEVIRSHDFQLKGKPTCQVTLSISLGVSVLNKDLDGDLFLRSADAALYMAKAKGRNQVVINDVEGEDDDEGRTVAETTAGAADTDEAAEEDQRLPTDE